MAHAVLGLGGGSSGRSLEHSTVQPKPRSRRATAWPMAPKPTSPTVLPDSRKAGRAKLPPIQRPSDSSAAACAMERRVEIISPIVSSATGTALLPVVRATLTPSAARGLQVEVVHAHAPLVQQPQPARGAEHGRVHRDLAGDGEVRLRDDALEVRLVARGAVGEREALGQQGAQLGGGGLGDRVQHDDGLGHELSPGAGQARPTVRVKPTSRSTVRTITRASMISTTASAASNGSTRDSA